MRKYVPGYFAEKQPKTNSFRQTHPPKFGIYFRDAVLSTSLFVLLIFLGASSGCSHSVTDSQQSATQTTLIDVSANAPNLVDTVPLEEVISTATTQQTLLSPNISLSEIIGIILASPDQYAGERVEVVGFYRGWDLLGEVNSGPPVSRSDWVIADNSGAIYVTSLVPQHLDPWSREETDTILHLVAIVEHNQRGTYLVAQEIKQMTP